MVAKKIFPSRQFYSWRLFFFIYHIINDPTDFVKDLKRSPLGGWQKEKSGRKMTSTI
jgi:hypothetical protein